MELSHTGSPGELDEFCRNVALQRSLGLEVHLLSPQDVKEMMPQLNVEDVVGVTYCPTDGFADTHSVVQDFAGAARRFGVKIKQETSVIGFRLYQSKVSRVQTSKGEFEAPVVVNAAGAYATQIGRRVGLHIPIRPSRRHVFFMGPVNEIPKVSLMVVDFRTGFWYGKEGAGLIFGMRNPDEPESFNTTVDWGFLATIGEVALNRLPLFEELGIARGQAGLHLDTPDYHAIVGEAPGLEGFYLACGFSGHGFLHSPAVGRYLAELILTEENISLLDVSDPVIAFSCNSNHPTPS